MFVSMNHLYRDQEGPGSPWEEQKQDQEAALFVTVSDELVCEIMKF